MWTCSKCGASVESTETTCPKCGAPQFETMNVNASSSSSPTTKSDTAPISSGVDNWAIAHIVFTVIFFIAAIGYWIAGADSYSKKAIYYDDAIMYAGMGVASLFLSSLIKGFGFVIKAAKLYLMKNGEKID